MSRPTNHPALKFLNQLSEADRDWLDRFDAEFSRGFFTSGESSLHTGDLRRECHRARRSRRQNVRLDWTAPLDEINPGTLSPEDALICAIDHRRAVESHRPIGRKSIRKGGAR